MNPAVKKKWLEALRSGQYEQGFNALHTKGQGGRPDQFCCLGVLCDLAAKEGVVTTRLETIEGTYWYGADDGFDGATSVLPPAVMKWAGLRSANPALGPDFEVSLASLNDSGQSFAHIADRIEHEL